MSGVGKKSLAEQILALSTPKPVSFHPDQDFQEDDTAAKLCNFSYEQEDELLSSAPPTTRARIARRVDLEEEEDPKYAGRVVSRKELENPDDSSDEGSEFELVGDEDDLLDDNDIPSDDVKMSDDEASGSIENDYDDDDVISGQSEAGDEKEDAVVGKGVETFPLASMKENIEKGKAARSQMKLQDGLLETRIKLQGVLSLSNRLPAPSVMPLFLKEGGAQVEEALQQTCGKLHQLLDSLLELQDKLSSRWREGGVPGGKDGETTVDEDEEICSDSEGENEREKLAAATGGKRGRKRKRSGSKKDYEEEICKRHEELRPHRNAVLSKWDEKTRLASGNITSKAFMEVDRSILSQIEHVLKDKDRLRKRTQLKRSVYHILGEPEETEVTKPENGDQDKSGDDQERDQHLKDYNENIFDDDDFYHQLLRELIERKTSSSESSDPVEMGRRWLELQKLRSKAKKKVDTKASKGRKLRYNVHPKLVDFMAPVERGTFSDSARNSLFSSLFGAHHYRQHQQ